MVFVLQSHFCPSDSSSLKGNAPPWLQSRDTAKGKDSNWLQTASGEFKICTGGFSVVGKESILGVLLWSGVHHVLLTTGLWSIWSPDPCILCDTLRKPILVQLMLLQMCQHTYGLWPVTRVHWDFGAAVCASPHQRMPEHVWSREWHQAAYLKKAQMCANHWMFLSSLWSLWLCFLVSLLVDYLLLTQLFPRYLSDLDIFLTPFWLWPQLAAWPRFCFLSLFDPACLQSLLLLLLPIHV